MYKLLATWLEWSNQLRKPSCPIFSCRLVDSRDIVELKLKQHDVEVTIRKKEAMPQPPPPPQPAVVYSSPPPVLPPPSVPASTPAPTLARATPSPTSAPAVKSAKSSLPPLKSPMAGTFYRSPAPGEPSFVKVHFIYYIVLHFCVMLFWNLMRSILPLGWRQSKEGASCMHHWGNEIDEWNWRNGIGCGEEGITAQLSKPARTDQKPLKQKHQEFHCWSGHKQKYFHLQQLGR